MWHYLVINRVRAHLGDMGLKLLTEKGFTAADLEKLLEDWQVVFVKGMNDFLYNMILECIDREGDFGVALFTSILNADEKIGGHAGRLMDHIVKAGTSMTKEQAKVRLMEIDEKRISLNDSPGEMELTCQHALGAAS